MFESDDFIANQLSDDSINFIQRKIFFQNPIVVYKIKLDEIIGESTLVMNVEFLGIDRNTKQSQQHPFNGGKILKRGIEWEDNSDILIADRPFIDNQGILMKYKVISLHHKYFF